MRPKNDGQQINRSIPNSHSKYSLAGQHETCYVLTPTCWKQRHQQTGGGVAVAHVLGAAVNGLMEGWWGEALKMDVILPLQAAALKHHPAAVDFDGGEATRAVALGDLEAFGAIPQTGQLYI